jgi:2,5-diketo-D-gluconate reductase B
MIYLLRVGSTQMPKLGDFPIGFGTWQLTPPEAVTAVRDALDIGYRHIDTAQIYENEDGVGEALETSSVPRRDIFLATKVWITNLKPKKVAKSTTVSLKKLRTDYVDLLYVHWPAGDYDPEPTLRAFADLVAGGQVRHIGVSNFTPTIMETALRVAPIKPIANQVECHPLLQQIEMLNFCTNNSMKLVAYSPIARGNILDHPALVALAQKYGRSTAQIALAWNVARGVIPIPKSGKRSHIQQNFDAVSIALEPVDVEKISAIAEEKRFINPSFAPSW